MIRKDRFGKFLYNHVKVLKISALQNKPWQILRFNKQAIDNENIIFDLIYDSGNGDIFQ